MMVMFYGYNAVMKAKTRNKTVGGWVDSSVEQVYERELKSGCDRNGSPANSIKSLQTRSRTNTTCCQVQQTAGYTCEIDICDSQGIAKVR